MTITSNAEWHRSPDILVGEKEHRRLTIAALTDVTSHAEEVDFLLYELDRAKVVDDRTLPVDIVRLNSIVRFRPESGEERTVKLVLPDDTFLDERFRLSVTSRHGAALLGLLPSQALSWLAPDGSKGRVEVVSVANALAR